MTIEEMAYNAYFMQQHAGCLTEYEYVDVMHGIEVRRHAYIKGAKEVLEKIEFAMCLGSADHVAIEAIKLCINELKGGDK